MNIARNIVLSSKLPISVPGTTVDRQCGSGQQAIHFAAQSVISGTQDCVIAGGIEMMSKVPIGSSIIPKYGSPTDGNIIKSRYPGVVFSQYEGAEIVAQKHDIKKEEMDEFAILSHQRAYEATKQGYFKQEIVPVKGINSKGEEVIHDRDEGIRYPIDKQKITQLPLLKKEGGRLSAATSSQIADGAAACLIVNERGLKKLGLRPRARIIGLALAGSDPVEMLGGPIIATKSVLEKTGLTIDKIDLYEINEAFASVPLAWLKALRADINKLNVNGGALALGHPLGASGVKLMATLLHELERRKGKYGLLSICEGGGTANATIIERVDSAKL